LQFACCSQYSSNTMLPGPEEIPGVAQMPQWVFRVVQKTEM